MNRESTQPAERNDPFYPRDSLDFAVPLSHQLVEIRSNSLTDDRVVYVRCICFGKLLERSPVSSLNVEIRAFEVD